MAWFRIAGSSRSTVSGLAASLRSGGLHEGASVHPDEPGVLLVADASVDIQQAVTCLKPAGRVLVVVPGDVGFDPWVLLECGADDAVVLSPHADVQTLLAKLDRWSAVDGVVDSQRVRSIAIGDAPPWIALLREVVEIATYTAAPVLIAGETGTGKEVVANLIHALDPRVGQLVLLDCTTIVPSLSGRRTSCQPGPPPGHPHGLRDLHLPGVAGTVAVQGNLGGRRRQVAQPRRRPARRLRWPPGRALRGARYTSMRTTSGPNHGVSRGLDSGPLSY